MSHLIFSRPRLPIVFDKNFLVGKVVNSLEKGGYEVLKTDGNFDVMTKRDDKVILIKVLMNVDALKEDQAMSLRSVAYFMNCQAIVVCIKNNRETLDDDVVYSRFEMPVMTPKLFEAIMMQDDMTAIEASKGRHTMEINTDLLRNKRKEMGFTLESLAEKIGVSKKAVYEIENSRVRPTMDTVDKLEEILSTDIKKPYKIKEAPPTYLKPKNELQNNVSKEFSRMGIENSPIYSSPFENVGKEKFSIITSISQNVDKLKKRAINIRNISDFFSSKAVVVAKKSRQESVHGVPIVLESDLPDIHTSKDLKKVIEEKE